MCSLFPTDVYYRGSVIMKWRFEVKLPHLLHCTFYNELSPFRSPHTILYYTIVYAQREHVSIQFIIIQCTIIILHIECIHFTANKRSRDIPFPNPYTGALFWTLKGLFNSNAYSHPLETHLTLRFLFRK